MFSLHSAGFGVSFCPCVQSQERGARMQSQCQDCLLMDHISTVSCEYLTCGPTLAEFGSDCTANTSRPEDHGRTILECYRQASYVDSTRVFDH